MAKNRYSDEDRAHAAKMLREYLPEGSAVGTVTKYGRGTRDHVELFAVDVRDRRVMRITYWVAVVTDSRMTENGIPRDGGNYDKAEDVVDSLSRALYGKGNALYRDRLL